MKKREGIEKASAPLGLSDLRLFLLVAEAGAFRRAEALANLGQPAISRRVRSLEDRLGVSLFERCSTGVCLTNAGDAIAATARSVIADVDTIAIEAYRAGIGQSGCVKIGIDIQSSVTQLTEILKTFVRSHADVDINIIEGATQELITQLNQRQIDVVLMVGNPMRETEDSLLLVSERVFVAVPTQHEWARLRRLRWEDTSGVFFAAADMEPRLGLHRHVCLSAEFCIDIQRVHMGREGIMSLVGLGLGASLVTDHWRRVLYPNVVFVPVGEEADRIPFLLTWRPENDNPALRRFISLARIHAKRNGVLS